MTAEQILDVVCDVLRIDMSDIQGRSQISKFSDARTIYTAIAKELGINLAYCMSLINRSRSYSRNALEAYKRIAMSYVSEINEIRLRLGLEEIIEIDPSETLRAVFPSVIEGIKSEPKGHAPICTYTESEKEQMIKVCKKAFHWGLETL